MNISPGIPRESRTQNIIVIEWCSWPVRMQSGHSSGLLGDNCKVVLLCASRVSGHVAVLHMLGVYRGDLTGLWCVCVRLPAHACLCVAQYPTEEDMIEWAKRESEREEKERLARLTRQEQEDLELAIALSKSEFSWGTQGPFSGTLPPGEGVLTAELGVSGSICLPLPNVNYQRTLRLMALSLVAWVPVWKGALM